MGDIWTPGRTSDGRPLWRDAAHGVEVAFFGRGADVDHRDLVAAVTGGARDAAWLRQIHSATVLTADAAGECGAGDALVGDGVRVLAVVTADCVPVLLAGADGCVAAVHAGWRGIVAGVVPAAVRALGGVRQAWIGPAIGSCCYEVGEDVATAVADASSPAVVSTGPAGRPHADLQAAVGEQLRTAGVPVVRVAAWCTRCEPELLWSYRRDRPCGRNVALVWRADAAS